MKDYQLPFSRPRVAALFSVRQAKAIVLKLNNDLNYGRFAARADCLSFKCSVVTPGSFHFTHPFPSLISFRCEQFSSSFINLLLDNLFFCLNQGTFKKKIKKKPESFHSHNKMDNDRLLLKVCREKKDNLNSHPYAK